MTKALSDAVSSASGASEHSEAVLALGLERPPTNQQIIDAAKKAYGQFQQAVDTATTALVKIVSSGSLQSELNALDDVNWQSPGITGSVTEPFYSSQDVQTAISAAANFPQLSSFFVGVFSKALPGGGAGTIGFDRDLRGSNPATSGAALKLDLYKNIVKVTPGQNLQFGNWIPQAGSLHDNVTGFYTSVPVQSVDVNLKILLTTTLEPYGFVVSTGAKVVLPVKAGVFAGASSSPQF